MTTFLWKGKYEDQSKLRGEEYIEGLCLLQANCFIQKLCKVKCNTWCELWNFTSHWVFEHKLHLKPFGKGLVYLGVAHLCSPNSASLKGCGPSMGAEVNWQQVFPYIKKRILKKNKKKIKSWIDLEKRIWDKEKKLGKFTFQIIYLKSWTEKKSPKK